MVEAGELSSWRGKMRRLINQVAMGFGGRKAHGVSMYEFEAADYSVVVKYRDKPPSPWRWEIYCPGRKTAIASSKVKYPTMVSANKAGKEALKLFLSGLVNA